MKIYISYAVGKREEYLLSILSLHLKREGFIIASLTEPSPYPTNTLTYESQTAIASSNMLIGVVTKGGGNPARITKEWDFALADNIPYGILAEEGVAVEEKYRPNTFYFKRSDLSQVERIIEDQRSLFELEHEPSENAPKVNRAQRITWFAVYDVLLTIPPVFAERKVSVS
jgi:hypothetical protein